jgi:phage terminase large subunit-like protein
MKSKIELLASLPVSARTKFLKGLSKSEAEALKWHWPSWARPEQLPPPGNWVTWLILSGRGWGKTRTGAEWVRFKVCGKTPLAAGQARRIALVAETAADARDVMVEGVTGILAVHARDFRPTYEPSKRRLTWPNGAVGTLFNAVEPDQLRGPQQDLAWSDELAKWRYARETWDMLQFGLRLGNAPQQVVTTTPKPIPVLREIMDSVDTVITRGSTYDNEFNLAPTFFRQVVKRYEGTRLGRQELNAEILEEAEGALWSRETIEKNRDHLGAKLTEEARRIAWRTKMKRIVVALDPAITSDEDSAEHGVIVAGLGHDGHGYILEDLSERLSPDKVARKAIAAYDRWQADRIIGEVNNGGEWIGHTIAQTAKAMKAEKQRASNEVAYSTVHASRGKQTRAEPVSALDEQGRVHHVGSFPDLEDQMCTWEPLSGQRSPDRLDARVWAITDLMLGGNDVFDAADSEFVIKPIKVPEHWPRFYALDIDTRNASCLWGARDKESDTLYIIAEFTVGRAELPLMAEAVRKKGSGIPGLFDNLARKRSKAEGQKLIDALLDLHLDIFTVQGDPEAAVTEIASRIRTKRLKVFATCTQWIAQYRAYRRDRDGELKDESDGLMRALDLLALWGSEVDAPSEERAGAEKEDDWAVSDRITGY